MKYGLLKKIKMERQPGEALMSIVLIEDENGNAKKVRNDATYNKDYLTGRYGAIPVLEEFDII